jgi:hypothetical protein
MYFPKYQIFMYDNCDNTEVSAWGIYDPEKNVFKAV